LELFNAYNIVQSKTSLHKEYIVLGNLFRTAIGQRIMIPMIGTINTVKARKKSKQYAVHTTNVENECCKRYHLLCDNDSRIREERQITWSIRGRGKARHIEVEKVDILATRHAAKIWT